RWRTRPRGRQLELDRLATTTVRAVIDRLLAKTHEPQWLDAVDLATVLRAVGIRFADAESVVPSEAGAAAERMGFPLVAKAIAPGLLHKSDVGGVVLGLDSAAAVEQAVTTLTDRMRVI